MAKFALLIGVSEYEPGLHPLPGAALDMEAMQRVFIHPKMGEFPKDSVISLKNPQRQEMEEAIYRLFADRQKEDLLLFYFSGHGIKDETGRLYLATRGTRKENGSLVPPSAVAATYLHDRINSSRSQRQVLILDCCFSGAIAHGMTVKDDGTIDLQAQLGGRGRAILTSSTAAEYSFGAEGADPASPGLSVYTRYLVEGIETGAADRDGDGAIAVEELHDYAARRVKEAAPAMTPKIYPVEEGYRIILARSPKDDPRLKYRKEFQARVEAGQGQISGFARRLLTGKRQEWGLPEAEAQAIEAEVLQPYEEYKRKLQDYEQALEDEIAKGYPFSPATQNDLKDYQKYLGLRDGDIAAIDARLLGSRPVPPVAPDPEPAHPIFSFDVVRVNDQGQEIDRQRHQAEIFTEALGNGVDLDLVKIPAGQFMMGQTEAEKQELLKQVSEADYQKYFARELPRHEVHILRFWMGRYPITQAQWRRVAALPQVQRELQPDPSRFKGDRLPVEQVNWWEAVEFCDRLSQATGHAYRLPTEAEWEYACRAGTTSPFYFGATITPDLANYDGNYTYGAGPKGIYRGKTTEVGSFPPNAFGLYDLHGNVWEWCADHWHDGYGAKPDALKLNGNTPWETAETSSQRVARGGSWINGPRDCRAALRYRFAPGDRNDNCGFRVVCVSA
ncbi:sulfatase-modifying factor protein [Leptolyngbya sp. 'hensonii']|uniref:caspase, EACC1-associated type n=1 Tax=Leptolyngbya sp. 'hensonii' TaxID=1922337 RepID=UPI00094F6B1A|nr:SUMF1/EgtB/PvdO family nonheme iron enzyme [Leptolyngbya sp. 'hensonii']OLP19520.1 sulfatase-modifying factor protein [Leptolyngbya sp. 'hensonii']